MGLCLPFKLVIMEIFSPNTELSFDDWCQRFKPVINHIDPFNSSFANYGAGGDEEHGIMFETFGDELKYVAETARAKPNTVWTYVDGDGGTYVINGMHFVNRIGYFVTKLPADADYEIIVSKDND